VSRSRPPRARAVSRPLPRPDRPPASPATRGGRASRRTCPWPSPRTVAACVGR
jgi:hypothetical protein